MELSDQMKRAMDAEMQRQAAEREKSVVVVQEPEIGGQMRRAMEAGSTMRPPVREQNLTLAGDPIYTTVAIFRGEYLDKQLTADDSFCRRLLLSAESLAEVYCRRTWKTTGTSDVVKTYSTRGKTWVKIQDCREVTSVVMGGSTLSTGQYDMDMAWGPATHVHLYTSSSMMWSTQLSGINDLVVTGKFGWDPPPDDIVDATYVMASRFFKERDAAYSDAVQAVEGVAMTFFRQLPPRVQLVLDYWRVPIIGIL